MNKFESFLDKTTHWDKYAEWGAILGLIALIVTL